jgi:hypothetical protein
MIFIQYQHASVYGEIEKTMIFRRKRWKMERVLLQHLKLVLLQHMKLVLLQHMKLKGVPQSTYTWNTFMWQQACHQTLHTICLRELPHMKPQVISPGFSSGQKMSISGNISENRTLARLFSSHHWACSARGGCSMAPIATVERNSWNVPCSKNNWEILSLQQLTAYNWVI